MDYSVIVTVLGPDYDPEVSDSDGAYLNAYGRYRQQNRLYNDRFVFGRGYFGANDPRHPDFDDMTQVPYDFEVEIVYDGMAWVMRRTDDERPLIWTPSTTALHPPFSGWITEDGVNREITLTRKVPPGEKNN